MEKVFIDTNVVIELFRGRGSVVEFFRKIESREFMGFFNIVVFLETLHVFAQLSLGKRPLSLKKRPKELSTLELKPVINAFSLLKRLPTDAIEQEEITEIIQKYGLLPNDALIATTCKYHDITKIATFDSDFKRVDFLEIIELE